MQELLSILANISRKCVKHLHCLNAVSLEGVEFSAEMSSRLIRDDNSDWNIFIILGSTRTVPLLPPLLPPDSSALPE
ncbi:MAG: hypothetical protein GX783_01715 [Clostridiales bacterium]|nr:hypothetical protein [Clostridiales bacterium]